jgi:hypothetical protein
MAEPHAAAKHMSAVIGTPMGDQVGHAHNQIPADLGLRRILEHSGDTAHDDQRAW